MKKLKTKSRMFLKRYLKSLKNPAENHLSPVLLENTRHF